MGQFSINYELVRFKRYTDSGFPEASDIYRRSTPRDQKTNLREINYWVDHQNKFEIGELFFFALKANSIVIGYAELAYIKKERILIIDYINLDPDYNSNSNFYSFYMLIVNYIDKHGVDYDYITKEIFRKSDEDEIRREDVRQYELENFKVINSLYIQPQLETNNIESMRDALIMLNTRASDKNELKKTEYLHIVRVIYDYYLYWDKKVCSDKEFVERSNLADSNLKKIEKSIDNEDVILNGYPSVSSSGTSRTKYPNRNKKDIYTALLISLGFMAIIVLVMAFAYYMEYDINAPIKIGTLFVGLFVLILILLNKNYLKLLRHFRFFNFFVGSE